MTAIDFIDLRKGCSTKWLTELLRHPIRPYDGRLRAEHLPVFIASGLHLGPRKELFTFLNEQNIPFVIIHTSDEHYSHDLSAYHLEHCLAVFREYYRPPGGRRGAIAMYWKSFGHKVISRYSPNPWKRIAYRTLYRLRAMKPESTFRQCLPKLPQDKVAFIPLGYLDQIHDFKEAETMASIPSFNHRPFMWSFYGDISKRDRSPMTQLFQNNFKGLLHGNKNWMGNEQATQDEYWFALKNSKFVPCPMGYVNLETARIYEALEAGAIPLLLKSHAAQPYPYFKCLWGSHPVPVFDDWKSAIEFLSAMSEEEMEALSNKISRWYQDLKKSVSQRIQDKLNSTTKQPSINLPSQDILLPLDRFDPSIM